MKLLWLFCALPVVLGQADFGKSYLKNSLMCHPWSCINKKLGFPNSLPTRSLTEETLKRLLPQGGWQSAVDKILDNCYVNRTRQYTNTCPGQALLHCIVDQMNENCPEESARKDDACSPVTSLAGLRYMFSQSRYDNLERNLPKEVRPVWFFRHYFEEKCCDLPEMFNSTLLQECGFTTFINYYSHAPRIQDGVTTVHFAPLPKPFDPEADKVKVIEKAHEALDVETLSTDPLDCCDMKEFIQPAWRSECGFNLSWRGHGRLAIANNNPTEPPVSTTTVNVDLPKDLMLVPQTCEKESCLFRKLGILDDFGTIDSIAYMKMLKNFTDAHPSWQKATARLTTKCLIRKVSDYEAECEINKILACTLDILTENCPYKRRSDDLCKHNKLKTGCQISSSKYRPKSRREVCVLPPLIHHDYLFECGLENLYKAEHVVVTEPKPSKNGWVPLQYLCQDQEASTTCIMDKMGILNKYKFIDYFLMKDRIRQFTSNSAEWSALLDIYTSAFVNIPMYGEHCSSQKKLLNVVDAMLMTCPVSKRKDTPECTKIFKSMIDTSPIDSQNVTKQKLDEMMKHYHHVFMPSEPVPAKRDRVIRRRPSKVVKRPIYIHGFLDAGDSPKVNVIDVTPSVITSLSKPIKLSPLGLDPKLQIASFHNDGIFRSGNTPYWLQERITKGFSTPAPIVPTPDPIPTNAPVPTPKVLPTIATMPTFVEPFDSRFRMMKPE